MVYSVLPRGKRNPFAHFSNLVHYLPDEALESPFDWTV